MRASDFQKIEASILECRLDHELTVVGRYAVSSLRKIAKRSSAQIAREIGLSNSSSP